MHAPTLLLAGLLLAQPPKPPALPAINPANARLDVVARGMDGPGRAIVYCPEAGLVAACESRWLHRWSRDVALGIRTGDTPPSRFRGHEGPILALAAGGRTVASVGTDGKLLLWDVLAETPARAVAVGGVVRAVAVSPDGQTVASAGEDGAVQLWESATGKPLAKLPGAGDWLLAVAFSPDGKQVAAGGHDGKVHLWEAASGQKLREMPVAAPPAANAPPPPPTVVSALAFSPDGATLTAGGRDGLLYQFQAGDGKLVRTLAGHTSALTDLAYHPSGGVLASASKDRSVRLWNPANGQVVKVLEGHTSWVEGLTFYHQGTRLASVSADGSVRVWDLR